MDKQYEVLPESDAREYELLWQAFHNAMPDATDEQLIEMVSIAIAICSYCHNNFNCYCHPAYDI